MREPDTEEIAAMPPFSDQATLDVAEREVVARTLPLSDQLTLSVPESELVADIAPLSDLVKLKNAGEISNNRTCGEYKEVLLRIMCTRGELTAFIAPLSGTQREPDIDALETIEPAKGLARDSVPVSALVAEVDPVIFRERLSVPVTFDVALTEPNRSHKIIWPFSSRVLPNTIKPSSVMPSVIFFPSSD